MKQKTTICSITCKKLFHLKISVMISSVIILKSWSREKCILSVEMKNALWRLWGAIRRWMADFGTIVFRSKGLLLTFSLLARLFNYSTNDCKFDFTLLLKRYDLDSHIINNQTMIKGLWCKIGKSSISNFKRKIKYSTAFTRTRETVPDHFWQRKAELCSHKRSTCFMVSS